MEKDLISITCPCCKYHYSSEEALFEMPNVLEGDVSFVGFSCDRGLISFYNPSSYTDNFICPKCGIWFSRIETLDEKFYE